MRDGREKRDSQFWKLRTSDLELSPLSPGPPFPLVVHHSRLARPAFLASLAGYNA